VKKLLKRLYVSQYCLPQPIHGAGHLGIVVFIFSSQLSPNKFNEIVKMFDIFYHLPTQNHSKMYMTSIILVFF
jgi:hypothetical protein